MRGFAVLFPCRTGHSLLSLAALCLLVAYLAAVEALDSVMAASATPASGVVALLSLRLVGVPSQSAGL